MKTDRMPIAFSALTPAEDSWRLFGAIELCRFPISDIDSFNMQATTSSPAVVDVRSVVLNVFAPNEGLLSGRARRPTTTVHSLGSSGG